MRFRTHLWIPHSPKPHSQVVQLEMSAGYTHMAIAPVWEKIGTMASPIDTMHAVKIQDLAKALKFLLRSQLNHSSVAT